MSKKIVVDAGHGGKDSGAVGVNGRLEKDDTLRMALRLGTLLAAKGYEITYTRTTDSYPSLKERYTLANNIKADAFFSCHRNAVSDAYANGFETLYAPNASQKSKDLAAAILDAMVSVAGKKRRAYAKSASVLNYTNMPAVTIECGFVTNAEDNTLFDTHFEAYMEAIANAIDKTLGGTGYNSGSACGSSSNNNTGGSTSGNTGGAVKTSGFTLTRILQKTTPNTKGTDVQQAQKDLITLGYSVGSTGADGSYGTGTVSAVKALQKAKGLTQDGIIGANTMKALGGTYKKNELTITKLLKQDSSFKVDAETKALQTKLISLGYSVGSTKADGKFGANTTKAVKAFQKSKGITQDGIVGKNTTKALGGVYVAL